jgi:3-hydroxybutyryl-CoA dehydrogenase
MGRGSAQVSAAAGVRSILFDVNEEVLQKAKQDVHKDLQVLVEKQKIAVEKKEDILRKIYFTADIRECRADTIIEAIIEKSAAKVELFNRLAQINTAQTLFASNTSSLSITALAKEITGPQRVAGLHFFNPAPVMKLVEIVKGAQTSAEVIDELVALTRRLGKEPVVCKDAPGFIVNRVARPYYIESLRLAEEGYSFETIDRLLENAGFKLGPFRLMDLIGNDINYAVSCSVYEQLGQPERLRPSAIQKEKIVKGQLGKKTKKGYYDY